MGRGVEYAVMGFILREAEKEGIKRVRAQYLPTSKNKPCEEFLSKCSFKLEKDQWIYAQDSKLKVPNYLEIVAE
jgi:predicted enzyme involved in methoxymalonyl-ACP biosynthesis